MVSAEWIGHVDYMVALKQQKALVTEREKNLDADDTFLLLEHPPTYTLGRSGHLGNLLLDEATLAQRGIAFYRVGRGGDITYHGPGQLVGYPILNLKRLYAARGFPRLDLHRYVRDIEQVLIQTLAGFGVNGWHYEGYPGVWVDTTSGPCKIAAIGIRISSKGISSHGFALNVNPDMSYFTNIIPCGIKEHGVISVAQLLKQSITITDMLVPLIKAFSHVFEIEVTL